MAKDRTLYLIGNAHIDPVWLWQWPEGRQEVFSTCRTALDLMDEDAEFVFCRSSAATYAWIEEYEPDLFEAIRERVREGRWVIVGGWWEQPDCNIPAGESLVRQALYGKNYFQSRFGVEVTTGYNVDTFGHPGTLPQILTKCGLDSYCFLRPGPHEKTLPSYVFRWASADGSEVIACRIPFSYGSGPEEIEEHIRRVAEVTPEAVGAMLCFFGVGNHGGGPTRANLACIHRLQSDESLPELRISSPAPFFERAAEVRDALPLVRDELQHHARGCYTAVSEIKRNNRATEQLLLATERLTSGAEAAGLCDTPIEDLTAAWKLTLFNQFHDILAGTSIRPACDDTRADLAEAQALATRWLRRGLHRMAAAADTSGEGQPLVVFNPVARPRRGIVECEVAYGMWGRSEPGASVVLLDDTGAEVPAVIGRPAVSTRSLTYPVIFTTELPSLGYRTYRIVSREPEPVAPTVSAAQTTLESAALRVEIDPTTGWLRSVFDKRAGVELLAGPANVLQVLRDDSDTWSHDIEAYRSLVGTFQLSGAPEVLVSEGPVAAVRMLLEHGDSVVDQEIILSDCSPEIEFRTVIDWRERHRMLKVAFPLAVESPVATFECAYGHLTREVTGGEEPVQRWFDVTGGVGGQPYGAALLNDGRYGCDVLGSEMRLSLVRSPIFAFHDPQKPVEGERYEYTDQGPQCVTYALLPHAGDWRDAEVVARAEFLNSPVRVLTEPAHAGRWPSSRSLLAHSGEAVSFEVLKRAEDGAGFVLRGYEAAGRGERVRVTFVGEDLGEVEFAPHEIRTWRLDRKGGSWSLTETDMLERPL